MMQSKGVIEKVDGFIGRKDAKAFSAPTTITFRNKYHDRENYQLEPVATIQNNIGETTFYRDYRDYVNSVKIRNADTTNQSILNGQEYYAWES